MGHPLTYKTEERVINKAWSCVSTSLILQGWGDCRLTWEEVDIRTKIGLEIKKISIRSWQLTKTFLLFPFSFFYHTQPTSALKCPDPSFCDITKWLLNPSQNQLCQWKTSLCVKQIFIGHPLYEKKSPISNNHGEAPIKKNLSNQSILASANLPLSGRASIRLTRWLAP